MKLFTLLGEIETRLKLIKKATGYHTDAGDTVLIEPDAVEVEGILKPYLRVFEQEASNDGGVPNTTRCKIKTFFVVEAVHVLQASETFTRVKHHVLEDVCRAVFGGSVAMGQGAISLNYEGHRFLPREKGSKSVVVQVRGSYVSAEDFARPV